MTSIEYPHIPEVVKSPKLLFPSEGDLHSMEPKKLHAQWHVNNQKFIEMLEVARREPGRIPFFGLHGANAHEIEKILANETAENLNIATFQEQPQGSRLFLEYLYYMCLHASDYVMRDSPVGGILIFDIGSKGTSGKILGRFSSDESGNNDLHQFDGHEDFTINGIFESERRKESNSFPRLGSLNGQSLNSDNFSQRFAGLYPREDFMKFMMPEGRIIGGNDIEPRAAIRHRLLAQHILDFAFRSLGIYGEKTPETTEDLLKNVRAYIKEIEAKGNTGKIMLPE